MRRFPASVHTDNIQQKLVGSLVLLKASQLFGPTVCFEYRTADPTMHCRSNSRRTLTWEVSMTTDSLRERFRGWVTGLDATTIENEKLKKRRVTLWHNQVCYFWFLSHRSVDFFFLFDTIFMCAFTCAVHIWQSEDTCWYTLMCTELSWAFCRLQINVHLGGSKESHGNPNPRRWRRQVQFCRNVWLVCFSVPLCCPAVLSDQTPAG